MLQNCLDFLALVQSFLSTVLSYDIISGVTIGTVLGVNLLVLCAFQAFAKKGN